MNKTPMLQRFISHPYRSIFVAMLAVIFAEVLAPNLIGTLNVGDFLIAALILAALAQTLRDRRGAVWAVVLGVPAVIARVVAAVRPDSPAQNSLVLILSAVFFCYLIWKILRDITVGDRPTGERIFGALCAYLFVGILFALLYAHLEFRDPGERAFAVSNQSVIESAASETSLLPIFTYYSFVTLTTLGYGDITPVSDAARTLAWMEALLGQLYLAVMVAGFVAEHISRGHQKGSAGDHSGADST